MYELNEKDQHLELELTGDLSTFEPYRFVSRIHNDTF